MKDPAIFRTMILVNGGVIKNEAGVTIVSVSSTGVASFAVGASGAVKDTNGNELVTYGVTASAINNVKITNAATGNGPTLSAVGDDTNIDLNLAPKAAGTVRVNIDHGVTANEAMYVTVVSGATSGEIIAGRFRAENDAAVGSTAEARGVFGQGIAIAALNAGTVTGIQGEAIAKATSTVVTVRGAFFAADSEGTPTSITNMYGCYVRVKSSVAPGTDFIGSVIETEKFGSGVTLDSFLHFKTTTWTSGEAMADKVIDMSGITGKVATAIVDLTGPNVITTGSQAADILLNSGRKIFSGPAVTRAAVRTAVGNSPGIGSIFIGEAAVATTKPNLYVKTANGSSDTDWERVVTAATD